MIIPADIRQLYKPVQPVIKHTGDHITYCEFLPEPKLQPFIYCYWQLKTTQPLQDPFIYRVVADGCMDIFFEVDHPEANFIMGFCNRYTEFSLNHSFHYIGIRFLPTMFPQIFKIDASELNNRFEQLIDVIPKTAQYISDNFTPTLNKEQVIALLDKHFTDIISKSSIDADSRLYDAIHTILKSSGGLHVVSDLNTGLSPRQLRRLFEFYIGDTPKTFSKVVRFQNILKAKPSAQSLRANKLFYDAGYYDQAHFIKDFKNFYGLTPSKAFGR
jgi:AraC-like DNA-binding protein